MPYCEFMLTLPPRLAAVANLVRKDSFVADIGTDHAYLPIWLAENGYIRGAVASDIAKGPLDRALKNIKSSNLSDKISTALTPGLLGIDRYLPNDICICGMGAETIIEILSAAPFVKNKSVRLILQPMTKAELLRKWLFENGFDIVDEDLCLDREKLYQIIVAEYDNNFKTADEFTALIGTSKIKNSIHYKEHLENVLKMLTKKLEGLALAGADVEDLQTTVDKIKQEMSE